MAARPPRRPPEQAQLATLTNRGAGARVDRAELLHQYRMLRDQAIRLLKALPANDRLPFPLDRATEKIAAAILASPAHSLDGFPNLTVHSAVFTPFIVTAEGGIQGVDGYNTFAEATTRVRDGMSDGLEVEKRHPQSSIDFLGPAMMTFSRSRVATVSLLLRELIHRIRPGRIVDGPVRGSEHFHSLLVGLAQDMALGAHGADAPDYWRYLAGDLRPQGTPASADRIDDDGLIYRYEQLHYAAIKLIEVLPSDQYIPAGVTPLREELNESLLRPITPTGDGTRSDGARHCLDKVPRHAPDAERITRPRLLHDAVRDGRRRVEQGWGPESQVFREKLVSVDPELVAFSRSRATVVAELLLELAARIEPGTVIDGPIRADDSYRKFVAQIAADLWFRNGGGAGPKKWTYDPDYIP